MLCKARGERWARHCPYVTRSWHVRRLWGRGGRKTDNTHYPGMPHVVRAMKMHWSSAILIGHVTANVVVVLVPATLECEPFNYVHVFFSSLDMVSSG